jgi:ribonuclease BN (tRNA processing enzyme)
VLITHLHHDHTAGLPDLILSPWTLGRRDPLDLFGPPGIATMVDHILAAYQQDIDQRTKGPEPANSDGWRVRAHEITPGLVLEEGRLRIEAFPVRHGSWAAFGFRFLTPERTIVISGDTAPTETIVEMSRDCGLLIHEVYSAAGFANLDDPWQRYHSQMHTSTQELARIANDAQPDLLVLYHQLLWGRSEDALLLEIRQGYDGAVVSGRDLEVY